MDLLLDTHALVWLSSGDERLGAGVTAALNDPSTIPLVSAATAWEYSDLYSRGRFPLAADLERVLDHFALKVTDLPSDLWRLAAALPRYHRDPIDRMLVAHAMIQDFAIATADANIAKYQVRTIW